MIAEVLAAVDPPVVKAPAPEHAMSATATAVLLIIAFIMDYLSIFPAWVQLRLTFASVVTAVNVGFDDSPLDKWTVDKASELIQSALNMADGAYIAGASARVIVGCLVGILSIWTLGCMLPLKWSKRLGRITTLQFKESPLRKLSPMVWGLAVPLGLLADMPDGWIGDVTGFCLDVYSWVTAPLPGLIFGAS